MSIHVFMNGYIPGSSVQCLLDEKAAPFWFQRIVRCMSVNYSLFCTTLYSFVINSSTNIVSKTTKSSPPFDAGRMKIRVFHAFHSSLHLRKYPELIVASSSKSLLYEKVYVFSYVEERAERDSGILNWTEYIINTTQIR